MPGNRWDLVDRRESLLGVDAAEISVIVPFFDNQHDLDLLLAGLSVQTHPLSRLQVVIADDGSPEPPTVPEVAQGLDIHIVRQENVGFRAGTARNLGVARSDGQVLLFLDGDTVPSPEYAQMLGRLPAALPDAVVSGRRRYADLSRWMPSDLLRWFAGRASGPTTWGEPDWMTQEYDRTGNLLAAHPRSYKYLIGAVLGCSREMFDDVAGFDESIVGYGGEDYDFTYRAYNCGAVLAYVHEAVAWHDGPEWSGRTDPGHQTGQKNREVMMLASRIPEPSMRGGGQVYPVADVLVRVVADDWTLGAGVLSIRSLLDHLDCTVTISGRTESAEQLRAAFAGDPRVRDPSHADAAHALRETRSRLHLSVGEPVRVTPAFVARILHLLEADTGTLVVSDQDRQIVVAESHRRRRRLARHPDVAAPVAQQWFSDAQIGLADSGLELIDGEPRLAAVFGGY